MAWAEKIGSLGLKMKGLSLVGTETIRSTDRLKALVKVLNESDSDVYFTATKLARAYLGREPTTSDICTTQTQLNLLNTLCLVTKITQYRGRSPRHSYKRSVHTIMTRGDGRIKL